MSMSLGSFRSEFELRTELTGVAGDLLEEVPTIAQGLEPDESIDPVDVGEALERVLSRRRLCIVEVDQLAEYRR